MSFGPIAERMRQAGLPELAVEAFRRHHELLSRGETGLIPEAVIEPVADLPDADQLDVELDAIGEAALGEAVVIKLNGGLGTSMGLRQAKSLLKVKDGLSFLDLIARQATVAGCPLVLMNSFATQGDSLAALAAYPALAKQTVPLDFVQHKVPKLDRRTLQPVDWPDEELTWCPPGHGDLYFALVTSGALEALLGAGRRYAFVSNADNLGAALDPRILGWFVREALPFAMEVADRTRADRKGGHLARRDGRLVLRESAQCPAADAGAFQDIERHRYFNTNNLWLDLRALERRLASDLPLTLPLIRNDKTVDPTDATSTPVYQLESAMGAAIEVFEGARALRVPRTRFAPVKTCADLLRVRSDATRLTADHRLVPAVDGPPTEITLDPRYYTLVGDLDARFPAGPPSLLRCRRLAVTGDVRFGGGVICEGEVEVSAEGDAPGVVPAGSRLQGTVKVGDA